MNPNASAPRRRSRAWLHLGAVLTAFLLLLGTAIPAAAAELMRVTFVRHGQSAGNASGLMDSSTPGPVLTAQGYLEAASVVGRIGDRNFDGVYASSMVRTQLTAAPLSQYLGLPIQVLPGLREIEAGDYEGTPESEASSGYMLAPLAWTFQGNLDARIPGSLDGHEFNARMNGALQTMYDNGDRNAVAFTHGAAMMFWTLMNAQNLTPAQKMALLAGSMPNTGYVVIEGNTTDGWNVVDWNGQQFSPERTFGAELGLQIRTLSRQLAATAKTVFDAFATRDLATIATAINQGIGAAVLSVAKFNRAVGAEVITRLEKAFAGPAPAAPATSSLPAANQAAVSESVNAKVGSPTAEKVRPVVTEVAQSDRAVAVTVDTDTPRSQPVSSLDSVTDAKTTDTPPTDKLPTDKSSAQESNTVGTPLEPKNEDSSTVAKEAATDTESTPASTKPRTVKPPRTVNTPGTVKAPSTVKAPGTAEKSESADSSSPSDGSDSGSGKDRADNDD